MTSESADFSGFQVNIGGACVTVRKEIGAYSLKIQVHPLRAREGRDLSVHSGNLFFYFCFCSLTNLPSSQGISTDFFSFNAAF